jgi:hypothetical protein
MNVTFRTPEGPFRLRGKKITGPDADSTRRVQAFLDAAHEVGAGPHDNDGTIAEKALRRAGFEIIHFEVQGEPDAAGEDVVEWQESEED